MKKSTKFFAGLAALGAAAVAIFWRKPETLDEAKKKAEAAGQKALDLANKYRDRLRTEAPAAQPPAPGTPGAPLDSAISVQHR